MSRYREALLFSVCQEKGITNKMCVCCVTGQLHRQKNEGLLPLRTSRILDKSSSFLYWNFIFLTSCKAASLVRFSAGINFSLGAWTVFSTNPSTALQALLQCTQIILNYALISEPKSRLSSENFSFFPSI